MTQVIKCCGERLSIRVKSLETVWLPQVVLQVRSKIYMEENPRSLVRSWSLDILDMSLKGKVRESNYRKYIQGNHGGICRRSYKRHIQVVQLGNQDSRYE